MVPSTLRRFLVTCLVGGAVGLAVNAASPHPVRLSESVHPASASAAATCTMPAAPVVHPLMPLEQALAACAACSAGFVDARGAADFEAGHIPGAVHLPPENDEKGDEALAPLRAFDTIVVYDADAGCELAQGVADRLVAKGFRDVRLLEGSWTAWEAARGPAQAGACESCGHRSARTP